MDGSWISWIPLNERLVFSVAFCHYILLWFLGRLISTSSSAPTRTRTRTRWRCRTFGTSSTRRTILSGSASTSFPRSWRRCLWVAIWSLVSSELCVLRKSGDQNALGCFYTWTLKRDVEFCLKGKIDSSFLAIDWSIDWLIWFIWRICRHVSTTG